MFILMGRWNRIIQLLMNNKKYGMLDEKGNYDGEWKYLLGKYEGTEERENAIKHIIKTKDFTEKELTI